jgi:hypothetical protein
VLVTNFTSWADPVRQENPQQTKGPPTSGEYINNFDSVKHILIIFQGIFGSSLCGFHRRLWKSNRSCLGCATAQVAQPVLVYAARVAAPSLQIAATIKPRIISWIPPANIHLTTSMYGTRYTTYSLKEYGTTVMKVITIP